MNRFAQVVLILLFGAMATAQRGTTRPLEIWVVDVEGGKAALYVTPTGQTAIIDTGFPGARDLDRIMAAVADAGVKQIDYLISTHYHVDHIGNLVELAKRIPVGTFVDHGPTVEGPGRAAGSGRRRRHPDYEAARTDRRFPGRLCRALHQGEAHRRETGRPPADHRRRVANRDVGRKGAEDAGVTRRRKAQSVLRELHADGRRGRPERSGRRAVGGQRRHPGPVPRG